MDFELSIPILQRVENQLKKSVNDTNALQRDVSTANRRLTTYGWKGQSANAFITNNEQWAADFSEYINNLSAVRDILKKVLQLAENLNRQALGFAGIFGSSTSGGGRNLLSLSRQAKAAVCDCCRRAINEYDNYKYSLQDLKSLNGNLCYSRFSLSSEISSSIREIENNQSKLNKLIVALNAYEAGIDELERAMQQWEASVVKPQGWNGFTAEFLQMMGDLDIAGVNALAAANSTNAFLASLLGLNLSCCQYGGDPVNMATGNFIYEREYLKTKGLFPLSFKIFYNAQEQRQNSLGRGWVHNFEVCVTKEENQATVFLEDGKQEIFIKGHKGSYYQSRGLDNTLSEKDGTWCGTTIPTRD